MDHMLQAGPLTALTMATRLHSEEIPLGSQTGQVRSLWSTRMTMLPSDGAWSVATSRSRKPGPNCATGMELPLSLKMILTLAE